MEKVVCHLIMFLGSLSNRVNLIYRGGGIKMGKLSRLKQTYEIIGQKVRINVNKTTQTNTFIFDYFLLVYFFPIPTRHYM